MLKVGITGGIGSGKTTACEIFKQLGIPIFNADQQAKLLYSENESLRKALVQEFGVETYLNENQTNIRNQINVPFFKSLLASPENREKLNSIVHPFVFQQFENWVKQQNAPYVIKEAAILFESGADKTVDKIIGVLAPVEIRIQRVLKRDPQRSEEELLKIIEAQLSNDELQNRSNYTIINDGTHSLIHQVRDLHQVLINESRHF
jgi:dephospho-CoA kinase